MVRPSTTVRKIVRTSDNAPLTLIFDRRGLSLNDNKYPCSKLVSFIIFTKTIIVNKHGSKKLGFICQWS